MRRVRIVATRAKSTLATFSKRRRTPPFDKLAVELVAKIFIFVVTVPRDAATSGHIGFPQNYLDIRWKTTNPLFLCAVCRRWRNIAFSIQVLWGELRLKFERPLKDGYERCLLQQWLQRSGTGPLSLGITPILYRNRDKDQSHVSLKAVIKGIKEDLLSRPRCSVIDIRTQHWDYEIGFTWNDLQDFLVANKPILEEIRIWEWYDQLTFHSDAYQKLRTLVCGNLGSRADFTDAPKSNLQRLETTASLNELYQALLHFPSIVDCVSFLVMSQATTDIHRAIPRAPRLVMQHLQSLCVQCSHIDSTPLWDALDLPSLKVACLDLPITGSTTLWPSLYSCFRRSRAPLEHLELLLQVSVPENELIELLSWHPLLKRVRIGAGLATYDTFWKALRGDFTLDDTFPCGTPIYPLICPHLEYLQLHSISEFNLENIAKTIVSRFLACDQSSPAKGSSPGTAITDLRTIRELHIPAHRIESWKLLSAPDLRELVADNDGRRTQSGSLRRGYLAIRSLYAKKMYPVCKLQPPCI